VDVLEVLEEVLTVSPSGNQTSKRTSIDPSIKEAGTIGRQGGSIRGGVLDAARRLSVWLAKSWILPRTGNHVP
jgi:hypothetical protein